MADLVQLDTAASMVGKSEVTLRRLIKANKIPFHKEKTLTGFVYMVDPQVVRSYYEGRVDVTAEELAAEGEPQPSEPRRASAAVRVAVAGESGGLSEYWQKKAELYEDRYHTELKQHAHTREELGEWRGRAEQAQSMLTKLLPAPSEAQSAPSKQAAESSSQVILYVIMTLVLLVIVAGAALYYVRAISG